MNGWDGISKRQLTCGTQDFVSSFHRQRKAQGGGRGREIKRIKLEPSASNELHAFIGPSLGQSCTVEFSLFYEVKCQQVHRRIFISSKKIKSK
jgi:hypothetical protein